MTAVTRGTRCQPVMPHPVLFHPRGCRAAGNYYVLRSELNCALLTNFTSLVYAIKHQTVNGSTRIRILCHLFFI